MTEGELSAPPSRLNGMDRCILWVAEGFGSGRLKPGPGTWGSVVGLLWSWLLLAIDSPIGRSVGLISAIAVAVPVCSKAEKLLGREDPPSVVLDEIVAMPLAFALPIWLHPGILGDPGHIPKLHNCAGWVLGFLGFRLFDIFKPWPIAQLQCLPGGWGIVADDLLAAFIASLILLALPEWA